jgi:hypothetical protein
MHSSRPITEVKQHLQDFSWLFITMCEYKKYGFPFYQAHRPNLIIPFLESKCWDLNHGHLELEASGLVEL